MLSEHQCQGWLEGYLLTGRHGLFNCYEAFIHIVDSMFNQHAKWLEGQRARSRGAGPIASLNYLLSSHVWRQDHNGFSHQDPGFIDHVVNKKADGRPRLLPAGHQLPAVGGRPLPAQPRLRQRDRGRQAAPARLADHGRGPRSTAPGGSGIWSFASNDGELGARRGHGLLRRRPHPRDAGRGATPAPAPARPAGCGWSTSSTSCGCSPTPSIPTA